MTCPKFQHNSKKKKVSTIQPLQLSFLQQKGSFPKGSKVWKFETAVLAGFRLPTQQDHSQWIGLKFCSLWKTTGLVNGHLKNRASNWVLEFEDFQWPLEKPSVWGFHVFLGKVLLFAIVSFVDSHNWFSHLCLKGDYLLQGEGHTDLTRPPQYIAPHRRSQPERLASHFVWSKRIVFFLDFCSLPNVWGYCDIFLGGEEDYFMDYTTQII